MLEDQKHDEQCRRDNNENSSGALNCTPISKLRSDPAELCGGCKQARSNADIDLLNTKCTSMNKFTCRFDIQIPNESGFRVARRIIGFKGGNMKRIIDMCKVKDASGMHGVKLRLRGKGSGFKEGPDCRESDDELHLCVSSKFLEVSNINFDSMLPQHRASITTAFETFQFACRSVEALLTRIYDEYAQFVLDRRGQVVSLAIKKYENNPALLFSQMDGCGSG